MDKYIEKNKIGILSKRVNDLNLKEKKYGRKCKTILCDQRLEQNFLNQSFKVHFIRQYRQMHTYVYIHNGWMIGRWMDGWIDR